MKTLSVFAIVLAAAVFGCTSKPEPQVPVVPEVLVTPHSLEMVGSNRVHADYALKLEGCKILWETRSEKRGDTIDVNLHDRSNCKKPVDELLNLHGKVIDRLLKDYPPSSIKSISTSGLSSLQPDGSWNAAVAGAARSSKDYQEYRKSYPDHKSKKSINSIFVELVLQTQTHAPFRKMLEARGLNFELYEVEKVFHTKAESDETVIDEAGTLWWKRAAEK